MISQALSKQQASKLISQDIYKGSENSGLKEFSKIIKHSIDNSFSIGRAIQDKLLLIRRAENHESRIIALSPSDKSISVFEQEMKEVINEAYNLNLTVKKVNPNLSSVVLLLDINSNQIMLGADLENSKDGEMGWDGVLKSNTLPKNNSVNIFKIPHHGSQNGHHIDIWKRVISKDENIAILTPYGRGRKKLPSFNDKYRILNLSEKSYITSNFSTSSKSKSRNPRVKKILIEFSYEVKERKYIYGHIRLRKSSFEPSQRWQVNLFGKACKLNDLTTDRP